MDDKFSSLVWLKLLLVLFSHLFNAIINIHGLPQIQSKLVLFSSQPEVLID